MTGIRTTAVATLLTGFALFVGAGKVQAQSYEHIDELAAELQSQARQLNREFRMHYSHTHEYRHLASDTSKMYRFARHIHDIAHYEGDLEHMRDDLHDLDRLFHHVEDLVDEIEHEAHHGHGHVHGHTGHVHGILHEMEDTLHHLQDDIEHMTSAHGHHDHGFEQVIVQPRPAIEFGNGRVRFRFGF